MCVCVCVALYSRTHVSTRWYSALCALSSHTATRFKRICLPNLSSAGYLILSSLCTPKLTRPWLVCPLRRLTCQITGLLAFLLARSLHRSLALWSIPLCPNTLLFPATPTFDPNCGHLNPLRQNHHCHKKQQQHRSQQDFQRSSQQTS